MAKAALIGIDWGTSSFRAWAMTADGTVVDSVKSDAGEGLPDVMRGEETELVGHIAADGSDHGLYVLPGTHSKWASTASGAITLFNTFMTGEFFAVLSRHSILGRLRIDGPASPRAFAKGLANASNQGGSILSTAFSARTLALFGRLAGNEISDYLSGLLIGTEVAAGVASHRVDGPVTDDFAPPTGL